MILLALDLSTKNTGYAIYQESILITHGCISINNNNLFNRIEHMTVTINDLIHKYKIDFVILEDVLPDDVHHNQSVYKALTYLQGFILNCLNSNNIPFKLFTASEWRKKCGIHTGRGIKRDVLKTKDIEFVQKHFDIIVNDDEADAICIGFAFIQDNIDDETFILRQKDNGELALHYLFIFLR